MGSRGEVSVRRKLRELEQRLYGLALHRSAREVAGRAGAGPRDAAAPDPTPSGFGEAFRKSRYCLLISFRRDGRPVPTPVWFAQAGERLYVRSDAAAGKVKRIRDGAPIEVAPCTARGRPTGSYLRAWARVIEDASEKSAAEAALEARYGLARRLYQLVSQADERAYIEITPDGAPPAAA